MSEYQEKEGYKLMTDTMKAVKIEGSKVLKVESAPVPQADGEKVLVKVTMVGICGSDLHIWENGDRVGLIMGHEFAGTVTDAGSRKDLKVGDRVTVIPLNPCGECPLCKDPRFHMCMNSLKNGSPGVTSAGAFTEYFLARPDMVRKLPDTMSDIEAAMIEPAAGALHAVGLAQVSPGDKVLVIGGGVIGMLCAAWARIYGASYVAITEPNDLRAKKAREMDDAHDVFDAKDPELGDKLLKGAKGMFDKAIDCSASAAGINAGIMALMPKGIMVLMGISYKPVPIMTLVSCLREHNFVGDIGYTIPEFEHTMDMISSNVLEAKRFVEDATIGLDDVQAAFERLASGSTAEVKILIQP